MAATTNQTLAQAQQFWASRTTNQRMLLGFGGLATLGLIALFTHLMMTPDYKPLVSGLEPGDAQALSSELTAQKIAFQLSPDGKSISVAADQLDAARLSVASSASTHSGRMGFEIFDKVSWGQTEFDEKVNYQRALEGELERTIVTLGGVKSARVHLVMASDSVFLDRDRAAKASVTLKVNRGGLSHDETQSIQRLVAGAVEGLKPADVSIIDADSNLALGANGDANTGEEGVERDLRQRLMATLGPVVGADHLRASVNVEYDPGTTEISEDKYDPAASVPLTLQKSSESSGPGNGVGGVPGTTSNVPKGGANVTNPTNSESSQLSTTENATYGVNKVTKHSIEPAGRVRRVTAALVIDDEVKRKLQPNGKWTETRTKRSPQELKQIELLAANAIGLDNTRGDVISVQNLAFDRADAEDVPTPTVLDKARKGLTDYSSVVRYAMLLLMFAMAYLLMIRPVQKHAFAAGGALPIQPRLPEGDSALPLNAPLNDARRALQLKEALLEKVKAEPVDSARLVQAWLRGGTE
jgi:flagellar M-ring protein FliF